MSSKTMTKVIAIVMIVFIVLTLFISVFDGMQTETIDQTLTWSIVDTGSALSGS